MFITLPGKGKGGRNSPNYLPSQIHTTESNLLSDYVSTFATTKPDDTPGNLYDNSHICKK